MNNIYLVTEHVKKKCPEKTVLTLVKTKDIPNDFKIDIKNIHEEEEKRKNVVTMEDVETGGDKWVRPEPKKKPILVKELETPKIEQPITIKTKKHNLRRFKNLKLCF